MPFTWHFFTGGRPINPEGLVCHRGPMVDVEIVMSQPFVHLPAFNTLRRRLLDAVVDTDLIAVQTRETVLRALNLSLGAVFARLSSQKKELQVRICEKRNSLDIERDLEDLNSFYLDAAKLLADYGLIKQQVDLLVSQLNSNSSILRVAGKCATILAATLIEMDRQNG